jgi:NADH-quinone oxidoreductase subunit A
MRTLPADLSQTLSPWDPGLLGLAVFMALVFLLVALILFLSFWLNPRKPEKEKSGVYECGVLPTGSARFRYPVPFYLVAIFFLIFDVEVVYIISWAVSFEKLGLPRWLFMTYFILVLLGSLVYLWRKGALEWGSMRKS